MSKNQELAADYFSRHENNECFITSDGRVFHTKGGADGFASVLKDNSVETFNRNVEAPAEEPKEITLADFDGFDAAVATYPEIKSLVKKLGLKSDSQKQEDLLAVIAAEIAKIQA